MRNFLFVVIFIMLLPIQSFGEWFNGISSKEDAYYAATMNDSGNILAEYCFPKTGKCIWMLVMKTACKEGDQYTALANSDIGSSHIMVYCAGKIDNNMYSYAFSDFDGINNIVTKALRLGFAVPLESDQFKVIRFDLSASNVAIAKMFASYENAQKKSSSQTGKTTGTTDQNL